MLEKIREGTQGIVAKSILGLVILTFALAGVGSYLSAPKEVAVAVVNGEKISQESFEQSFQNERARLQQQFGEMYNLLAADQAYMNNFRSEVLERLIDERLQQQFAAKLGLRASDNILRDVIRKMPEFQIDGQFNNDRYLALLSQAGYQPNEFRDLLRQQLPRNQMMLGLLGSEFATVSEGQLLSKLQQQTRDIQYARLSAAVFENQVELTEDMLQVFYATTIAKYETEHKIAVEYVELSVAALVTDITVTEQQIADYYAANKNRYTQAERHQVAHIMLETEDENAELKAEAEQLLQQLQQGADFAELAKLNSSDTFSAENGGVLGWLQPGDMDEAFEQAAFALSAEGELSSVVKSNYGYHIIKLVAYEPAVIKPLPEVQQEIADFLKQQQASEEFYTLQQRLAEVSFEVPDNLEEAATVLNAEVKTTALFSRYEAPAPLSNPQVLNRIFDARFIGEGLNSDVIEVAPQHAVVVRVKEQQLARTLSLEEVIDDVKAELLAEKTHELALAQAQELISKQYTSFAELTEQAGLTLEDSPATPRFGGTLETEIRVKAFALPQPPENGFSVDAVSLANGDVALVAVNKITNVDVVAAPDNSQLEGLSEQYAELAYRAMLQALKAEAKITRNLRSLQQDQESF